MSTIQIKSAFVEDNKGFVVKIAEPHSKKNDAGGYDTVSRTFFDVKVRKDSDIDLSQFVKGQRVQVEGRLMTDVREYEGKKFYTLTIWADRVESAQGSGNAASQPVAEPWNTPAAQDSGWGNNAQVPF